MGFSLESAFTGATRYRPDADAATACGGASGLLKNWQKQVNAKSILEFPEQASSLLIAA